MDSDLEAILGRIDLEAEAAKKGEENKKAAAAGVHVPQINGPFNHGVELSSSQNRATAFSAPDERRRELLERALNNMNTFPTMPSSAGPSPSSSMTTPSPQSKKKVKSKVSSQRGGGNKSSGAHDADNDVDLENEENMLGSESPFAFSPFSPPRRQTDAKGAEKRATNSSSSAKKIRARSSDRPKTEETPEKKASKDDAGKRDKKNKSKIKQKSPSTARSPSGNTLIEDSTLRQKKSSEQQQPVSSSPHSVALGSKDGLGISTDSQAAHTLLSSSHSLFLLAQPPSVLSEGATVYVKVPAFEWLSESTIIQFQPIKMPSEEDEEENYEVERAHAHTSRIREAAQQIHLYVPTALIECAREISGIKSVEADPPLHVHASLPSSSHQIALLSLNAVMGWRAKYDDQRQRWYYMNLLNRRIKGWKVKDLASMISDENNDQNEEEVKGGGGGKSEKDKHASESSWVYWGDLKRMMMVTSTNRSGSGEETQSSVISSSVYAHRVKIPRIYQDLVAPVIEVNERLGGRNEKASDTNSASRQQESGGIGSGRRHREERSESMATMIHHIMRDYSPPPAPTPLISDRSLSRGGEMRRTHSHNNANPLSSYVYGDTDYRVSNIRNSVSAEGNDYTIGEKKHGQERQAVEKYHVRTMSVEREKDTTTATTADPSVSIVDMRATAATEEKSLGDTTEIEGIKYVTSFRHYSSDPTIANDRNEETILTKTNPPLYADASAYARLTHSSSSTIGGAQPFLFVKNNNDDYNNTNNNNNNNNNNNTYHDDVSMAISVSPDTVFRRAPSILSGENKSILIEEGVGLTLAVGALLVNGDQDDEEGERKREVPSHGHALRTTVTTTELSPHSSFVGAADLQMVRTESGCMTSTDEVAFLGEGERSPQQGLVGIRPSSSVILSSSPSSLRNRRNLVVSESGVDEDNNNNKLSSFAHHRGIIGPVVSSMIKLHRTASSSPSHSPTRGGGGASHLFSVSKRDEKKTEESDVIERVSSSGAAEEKYRAANGGEHEEEKGAKGAHVEGDFATKMQDFFSDGNNNSDGHYYNDQHCFQPSSWSENMKRSYAGQEQEQQSWGRYDPGASSATVNDDEETNKNVDVAHHHIVNTSTAAEATNDNLFTANNADACRIGSATRENNNEKARRDNKNTDCINNKSTAAIYESSTNSDNQHFNRRSSHTSAASDPPPYIPSYKRSPSVSATGPRGSTSTGLLLRTSSVQSANNGGSSSGIPCAAAAATTARALGGDKVTVELEHQRWSSPSSRETSQNNYDGAFQQSPLPSPPRQEALPIPLSMSITSASTSHNPISIVNNNEKRAGEHDELEAGKVRELATTSIAFPRLQKGYDGNSNNHSRATSTGGAKSEDNEDRDTQIALVEVQLENQEEHEQQLMRMRDAQALEGKRSQSVASSGYSALSAGSVTLRREVVAVREDEIVYARPQHSQTNGSPLHYGVDDDYNDRSDTNKSLHQKPFSVEPAGGNRKIATHQNSPVVLKTKSLEQERETVENQKGGHHDGAVTNTVMSRRLGATVGDGEDNADVTATSTATLYNKWSPIRNGSDGNNDTAGIAEKIPSINNSVMSYLPLFVTSNNNRPSDYTTAERVLGRVEDVAAITYRDPSPNPLQPSRTTHASSPFAHANGSASVVNARPTTIVTRIDGQGIKTSLRTYVDDDRKVYDDPRASSILSSTSPSASPSSHHSSLTKGMLYTLALRKENSARRTQLAINLLSSDEVNNRNRVEHEFTLFYLHTVKPQWRRAVLEQEERHGREQLMFLELAVATKLFVYAIPSTAISMRSASETSYETARSYTATTTALFAFALAPPALQQHNNLRMKSPRTHRTLFLSSPNPSSNDNTNKGNSHNVRSNDPSLLVGMNNATVMMQHHRYGHNHSHKTPADHVYAYGPTSDNNDDSTMMTMVGASVAAPLSAYRPDTTPLHPKGPAMPSDYRAYKSTNSKYRASGLFPYDSPVTKASATSLTSLGESHDASSDLLVAAHMSPLRLNNPNIVEALYAPVGGSALTAPTYAIGVVFRSSLFLALYTLEALRQEEIVERRDLISYALASLQGHATFAPSPPQKKMKHKKLQQESEEVMNVSGAELFKASLAILSPEKISSKENDKSKSEVLASARRGYGVEHLARAGVALAEDEERAALEKMFRTQAEALRFKQFQQTKLFKSLILALVEEEETERAQIAHSEVTVRSTYLRRLAILADSDVNKRVRLWREESSNMRTLRAREEQHAALEPWLYQRNYNNHHDNGLDGDASALQYSDVSISPLTAVLGTPLSPSPPRPFGFKPKSVTTSGKRVEADEKENIQRKEKSSQLGFASKKQKLESGKKDTNVGTFGRYSLSPLSPSYSPVPLLSTERQITYGSPQPDDNASDNARRNDDIRGTYSALRTKKRRDVTLSPETAKSASSSPSSPPYYVNHDDEHRKTTAAPSVAGSSSDESVTDALSPMTNAGTTTPPTVSPTSSPANKNSPLLTAVQETRQTQKTVWRSGDTTTSTTITTNTTQHSDKQYPSVGNNNHNHNHHYQHSNANSTNNTINMNKSSTSTSTSTSAAPTAHAFSMDVLALVRNQHDAYEETISAKERLLDASAAAVAELNAAAMAAKKAPATAKTSIEFTSLTNTNNNNANTEETIDDSIVPFKLSSLTRVSSKPPSTVVRSKGNTSGSPPNDNASRRHGLSAHTTTAGYGGGDGAENQNTHLVSSTRTSPYRPQPSAIAAANTYRENGGGNDNNYMYGPGPFSSSPTTFDKRRNLQRDGADTTTISSTFYTEASPYHPSVPVSSPSTSSPSRLLAELSPSSRTGAIERAYRALINTNTTCMANNAVIPLDDVVNKERCHRQGSEEEEEDRVEMDRAAATRGNSNTSLQVIHHHARKNNPDNDKYYQTIQHNDDVKKWKEFTKAVHAERLLRKNDANESIEFERRTDTSSSTSHRGYYSSSSAVDSVDNDNIDKEATGDRRPMRIMNNNNTAASKKDKEEAIAEIMERGKRYNGGGVGSGGSQTIPKFLLPPWAEQKEDIYKYGTSGSKEEEGRRSPIWNYAKEVERGHRGSSLINDNDRFSKPLSEEEKENKGLVNRFPTMTTEMTSAYRKYSVPMVSDSATKEKTSSSFRLSAGSKGTTAIMGKEVAEVRRSLYAANVSVMTPESAFSEENKVGNKRGEGEEDGPYYFPRVLEDALHKEATAAHEKSLLVYQERRARMNPQLRSRGEIRGEGDGWDGQSVDSVLSAAKPYLSSQVLDSAISASAEEIATPRIAVGERRREEASTTIKRGGESVVQWRSNGGTPTSTLTYHSSGGGGSSRPPQGLMDTPRNTPHTHYPPYRHRPRGGGQASGDSESNSTTRTASASGESLRSASSTTSVAEGRRRGGGEESREEPNGLIVISYGSNVSKNSGVGNNNSTIPTNTILTPAMIRSLAARSISVGTRQSVAKAASDKSGDDEETAVEKEVGHRHRPPVKGKAVERDEDPYMHAQSSERGVSSGGTRRTLGEGQKNTHDLKQMQGRRGERENGDNGEGEGLSRSTRGTSTTLFTNRPPHGHGSLSTQRRGERSSDSSNTIEEIIDIEEANKDNMDLDLEYLRLIASPPPRSGGGGRGARDHHQPPNSITATTHDTTELSPSIVIGLDTDSDDEDKDKAYRRMYGDKGGGGREGHRSVRQSSQSPFSVSPVPRTDDHHQQQPQHEGYSTTNTLRASTSPIVGIHSSRHHASPLLTDPPELLHWNMRGIVGAVADHEDEEVELPIEVSLGGVGLIKKASNGNTNNHDRDRDRVLYTKEASSYRGEAPPPPPSDHRGYHKSAPTLAFGLGSAGVSSGLFIFEILFKLVPTARRLKRVGVDPSTYYNQNHHSTLPRRVGLSTVEAVTPYRSTSTSSVLSIARASRTQSISATHSRKEALTGTSPTRMRGGGGVEDLNYNAPFVSIDTMRANESSFGLGTSGGLASVGLTSRAFHVRHNSFAYLYTEEGSLTLDAAATASEGHNNGKSSSFSSSQSSARARHPFGDDFMQAFAESFKATTKTASSSRLTQKTSADHPREGHVGRSSVGIVNNNGSSSSSLSPLLVDVRVTVVLDLNQREMSLIINGKQQGVAFQFEHTSTTGGSGGSLEREQGDIEPLFPIVTLGEVGDEAWLVKPSV